MAMKAVKNSPLGTNANRHFTLRWNDHDHQLNQTIIRAWEKKLFLDVTLSSEHGSIGAHRVVLCACSNLLECMLISAESTSPVYQQEPHNLQPKELPPNSVLYFSEIAFDDLKILVEFMYRGIMTVTYENLPSIMRAAQILKLKGIKPHPIVTQDNHVIEKLHETTAVESSYEQMPTDCKFPSPVQKTPVPFADRLILTGSRSRIVWDKAHLVYLENVYKKEVQHPNIEQCQLYAEELCQIPLTEATAHLAEPSTNARVTYQNVRNWFQNRRNRCKIRKNEKFTNLTEPIKGKEDSMVVFDSVNINKLYSE